MTLLSQLAALAAIVGTGVVYGTDVFCALVQRPALARVDSATLTAATPDAKPVISTTTQILRRQPDGGWVHIVDDPFFG